jgi:hypothetical protein
MQNSFSMKANRLSTKRRDSKMNRKGVPIAGEQESSKGITMIEAVSVETEASATGGK